MIAFLVERLGRFPVRVRRGLARGSWWSVYPCSAYWRTGGNDPVIERILLEHAARPGAVCWDIGAHHGIYAVGLARAVGPTGRVEAFEPDPVSFGRLAWHRRLNLLAQLRPHRVAVSDRTGSTRLLHYGQQGATTSHLAYPGETEQNVAGCDVAGVALDDWIESGLILAPDFVKLDVEGHGARALNGMRRMLAGRRRPVLLCAVHTAEEHAGTVGILHALGYRLRPADSDGAGRLDRDHFGELLALPPTLA